MQRPRRHRAASGPRADGLPDWDTSGLAEYVRRYQVPGQGGPGPGTDVQGFA